jgi:nickel-dependent lactate racemase
LQIHLPTSQQGGISLEVPSERLVADWSHPASRTTQDNGQATVSETLRSPLGYPPLAQSVIPGDHITLAVDPDTPQVASVLTELVSALIDAGSSPTEITVLLAGDRDLASRQGIISSWPESWQHDVHFVAHHPEDETAHAYLAATREGRPVYLNRAIGDADVVIPVGLLRLDETLGYRGVHGSWFPLFSNVETQLRHQSPGNVQWQTHERRRREETAEAAWLLGVHLMVQVLPGPNGTIAGVYCGDAEQVAREGTRACRELWAFEVQQAADLVVASLDNEAGQQSWRHVARALDAASHVVNDGGAIVLWTDLADDPGPALQALANMEATEDEQRLAILKHRSADADAAKVIADCLRTCRVYLRSRLDDSKLEEIGIAPLHEVAELQRLIAQSPSTIVVGSAEYAGLHVKQPVEA